MCLAQDLAEEGRGCRLAPLGIAEGNSGVARRALRAAQAACRTRGEGQGLLR